MSYYQEDKEDEGIICPDCGGTGSHPYQNKRCTRCHGTGMIQDNYEIDYPVVSIKKLKNNRCEALTKPEVLHLRG